jgi:hypothetical protein
VTRRTAVLGLATGATLLLAGWVSGAGPVGIFARRDFLGEETSAPGKELASDTIDAPRELGPRGADVRPANDFLVNLLDLALRALLAVVVLIVLVAIARAVREHLRSRGAAAEDQVTADVLPEILLEGAREGEELLARGTAGNAVVAAWVALEDAVRSAGVRQDDSRTAAELVTTVLRSYSVDRGSLDTLAALYREARFSRHPIGEDMRATARDALQRVQVDLRRAVAQGPRTQAGRR